MRHVSSAALMHNGRNKPVACVFWASEFKSSHRESLLFITPGSLLTNNKRRNWICYHKRGLSKRHEELDVRWSRKSPYTLCTGKSKFPAAVKPMAVHKRSYVWATANTAFECRLQNWTSSIAKILFRYSTFGCVTCQRILHTVQPTILRPTPKKSTISHGAYWDLSGCAIQLY